MKFRQDRPSTTRPVLVKGDADPVFLTPDDVTSNVRVVHLEDKVETLGDVVRVGNLERRPKMEMLQIKQLIVRPANSIAPDISTRLRGIARLSMKN
jgi:hypothetical protein